MAGCKFRVIGIAAEPNLRGQEMRRIRLGAVPSEPFAADATLAKGQPAAPPDGGISMLVSPSFAKRFSLGDEFDVMFRERGE